MYSLFLSLLFRLDPERAHTLTLSLLSAAGAIPPVRGALRAWFDLTKPGHATEVFGLRFKNKVGLAAGYAKNGEAIPGLAALGFGHLEVGTVTRIPQPGNPRPRVHRVIESRGVINSMGFPNAGVEALMSALEGVARVPYGARLGINIGKGKDTPIERAAEDYVGLLRRVYTKADYIAVNISSPNTMNLRQLQARDAIEALLKLVMRARDELPRRVPVLVKIAPDLTEAELSDAVMAIAGSGADGVIATNTTLSREGIPDYTRELKGGLSGAPLTARSTGMIRAIVKLAGPGLPVIGVGGIMSAADARAKLDAGAALVQIYTGLIYAGPGLPKQILSGIS